MTLPRDVELRIRGHLYEIRQTNDEIIGSRQGLPPAVKGYKRTLESVGECATVYQVDEIAEHIKTHMRREGQRPPNRNIRRKARSVISQAGYPADGFLNTV